MKLLTSLSVLAAAVALASPVFAQSANKTVTVTATLTSVCRFTTSGPLALAMGSYTAFTTTAVTKTNTAGIECTRGGGAPSFSFDGATATQTTASGSGTVAGLAFTIGSSYLQDSAGAAPDATNPGGLPRTGTVTVTATIAAGQAGDSTASATASPQLTVTF